LNIEKIIEPYIEIQGGLIPALHAVQNDTGYLDIQSIKTIADGFNISTAEVIDVITYYDDFRLEKEGQYIIKVCQAEACQSLGCRTLLDTLKSHFELDLDETSNDHLVTLKEVFCLGNCALSPSVMINEDIIGRASSEKILAYLSEKKNNSNND
jgi:formate dehydrogenase subunit gamma